MNKNQPSKQNKLGLGASRTRSDAEVLRRLAGVRLLSLDVDGVMTDGGLYYTDDGRISRKYNVKDGVGIKRVMDTGIQIVIISAGVSGSVPERAETLGIEHVFTGVEDKRAVLETLCDELGIGLESPLKRIQQTDVVSIRNKTKLRRTDSRRENHLAIQRSVMFKRP